LKKGLKDPYTFFNAAWNKVFKFYPYFAFSVIKDKPDLIHAHFGPSGYNFLTLKRIFKIPLITTFYGYDLSLLPSQNQEWKIKYKELFREGEIFLVEGNHMKKCLIELECPEEKIIVQHLGINLDQIKYMPRKLLSEDEEIGILISASFTEKKAIPYAVEAFGRVRQAHPELKLKLTIVGDSRGIPEEEREKEKIFHTIGKYNLKNCVNLLGYQPYSVFLRELYRHHIFIHPSVHASDGDTEGGVPVSIIEASASGMPILSTTHCDIPEVVIGGESGYLVQERDVDALTAKLEFLVLNPEIWGQMGKKGREHIEKNYDVITQVQKLEEIYDKVLTRDIE
jgi:colanic acid/amylovoran biosynthesis glycosyltransferase